MSVAVPYAGDEGYKHRLISTNEFNVQRYDGAAEKVLKPRPVSVAPRTVPLEDGYTKGSRTMLHLGADLGLARWLYGSEQVTVFVTLDPLILKLPYSSRRRQE